MTERRRSIGIFNDVMTTEAALKELDNSHYSLDRVFVIARNQDGEQKLVGKFGFLALSSSKMSIAEISFLEEDLID